MRAVWLLLLAAALLPGCRREPPAVSAAGAREPAQAVLLLTRHLRENDLAAFARDAVPPGLHRQLGAAWRAGRTRWPLDELPFDEHLPQLLGALTEPGAEQRLQQVFDRQFAGETGALKAAATALGLFGVQYLRHQGDFSADERAHYLQFVQALSRWGAAAPLADPKRAKAAIPRLVAAARASGLRSEADFARIGMDGSLRRLSGVLRTLKSVLAGYGLRLDRSLAGLQARTVSRQGDRARVRMRYTLADSPVEAEVEVERIGGRWYLSDYLRHARAAVGTPPAPADEPDVPAPPPGPIAAPVANGARATAPGGSELARTVPVRSRRSGRARTYGSPGLRVAASLLAAAAPAPAVRAIRLAPGSPRRAPA